MTKEVDKNIVNLLKDGAKNAELKLHSIFGKYLKAINSSKSVEEIMKAKRDLITNLIENLPLDWRNCYFCLENDYHRLGDGICLLCGWGRCHMRCSEDNSDYKKMKKLLKETAEAVGRLIYDDEPYYNLASDYIEFEEDKVK